MSKETFIQLLKDLCDEQQIGVHEQVEMMDGSKPLLDEYGEQVINDVVIVGDGRLYIERDGNEGDAEQNLTSLLRDMDEYLPDIVAALEAWWRDDQAGR